MVNTLKCHSFSVISLNSLGFMVTWITLSTNIIDTTRLTMTGTQTEKARLSVLRTVDKLTQI
jgi:hypothetical protein